MTTTWLWATVTQVSPSLAVQLDGDTAALPITPDCLVNTGFLTVGSRVRCELTAQAVVVHGPAGGGTNAPSPYAADAAQSSTVVTYSGTFSGYTASPWNGLYVARRGGIIFLTGPVTNSASWSAGATVGVLPTGFRPGVLISDTANYAGGTVGQVKIDTSGNITAAVAGSAGQTINFGMSFLAA